MKLSCLADLGENAYGCQEAEAGGCLPTGSIMLPHAAALGPLAAALSSCAAKTEEQTRSCPSLPCPVHPRVTPRSCSSPRLLSWFREHVGSAPAAGGHRYSGLLPSPAPSLQAYLLAASTGARPCGPRASLARVSPTAGWGEGGGGMAV